MRQAVYATQPSLVLEGKIGGGNEIQTVILDRDSFQFGLGTLLPQ